MNILLDLDDVLCDWQGTACRTFAINYQNPDIKALMLKEWGLKNILDEALMWKHIGELGEEWWANLQPLPWAHDLYTELKRLGDVCILTSPSSHPSSAAGKVAWINKYLMTKDFLIGKPKHFCANRLSILIDDRPLNCAKFVENGGNAYLFPLSFNLFETDPTGEKEIQKIIDSIVDIKEKQSAGYFGTRLINGNCR